MTIKKTTCILVGFTAIALISCASYTIKKEPLSRVKTIALVQLKANASCETDGDRMKYLNTQVHSEFIASNFMLGFNSNSTMALVPFKTVFKGDFKNLKGFTAKEKNRVLAKDTIDIGNYSSNDIAAIASKINADAFMVVSIDYSLWGQSLVMDIDVYNRGAELIWKDRVRGESTYIIKDKESPYTSDFEVFGDSADMKTRRHQDELLVVLAEAVSNAAREFASHAQEALR